MAGKEQHPFFYSPEALREGIEDYELLRVLSIGRPDEAMRLAQKAVPHFTDYIRNVSSFRTLHAELLAAAP